MSPGAKLLLTYRKSHLIQLAQAYKLEVIGTKKDLAIGINEHERKEFHHDWKVIANIK